MKVRVDQAIAVLSRTPAVLREMLDGLSDEWLHANEGAETWSPFDIVGHLLHGEKTDWIARMMMILEYGESKTFEPFDRFAQTETSRGKSIRELLEDFAEHRKENLQKLEDSGLSDADYARTGRHPAFGRVTLEELLATWVTHDLGHVAQIARVMAKQPGTSVGPWQAYLPILRDRTEGPESD